MYIVVDDRKQLKIFVTSAAKGEVEKIAERYDMKEQGVASRIYEWFGRQPESVQKWILGLVNGTEGEGMRLFAQTLLMAKQDALANRMPSEERPPATITVGGRTHQIKIPPLTPTEE